MIVPITLIGLVIIVWLQYTYMSDDNDKPLYRKIFNRVKLPAIYLCVIYIIYKLCVNKPIIQTKRLITDQKIFNNAPPF